MIVTDTSSRDCRRVSITDRDSDTETIVVEERYRFKLLTEKRVQVVAESRSYSCWQRVTVIVDSSREVKSNHSRD